MNFIKTHLEGLFCLETSSFNDERGMFARLFCHKEFEEHGLVFPLAQINTSTTVQKGTIRGMHYQNPPFAEIKIVRCLQGACYDVAIDLRKDSPTFLQYHAEILSAENMKAFYIPKGFAHGFQTLKENTQLLYMHSEFYNPEHEASINYLDPKIDIQWQEKVKNISEKDKNHLFITKDFKGLEI